MNVVGKVEHRALSVPGQTYVALVAVVATLTTVADTPAWYVVLVIMSLPLSLLALWVGFYAGTAVGFTVGDASVGYPWTVAVVWVTVWTAAAWLNARIAEKVARRGWEALRSGSD